MATPKKVATVEQTRKWYEQSIGLIFTNYSGLTVGEMQELRKSLKSVGAEFHVVKNTLFRRALGDDIAKLPEDLHSGTTATVFVYREQPACAKAVVTFGKSHQALQIKGGYFDGRVFSAKEIEELSKLPSREELLSMIVGLVAAPISNVVGVMNEIIAAPIRVVDAIIEKHRAAPSAKEQQPGPNIEAETVATNEEPNEPETKTSEGES